MNQFFRLKSLGLRARVKDTEEELHFLVDFDELGAGESHPFEEHEEEEDGDPGPGLQDACLPVPVLVLEVANLLTGPQLQHSGSKLKEFLKGESLLGEDGGVYHEESGFPLVELHPLEYLF